MGMQTDAVHLYYFKNPNEEKNKIFSIPKMKLLAEVFTICAANAISKGSADAECTMQCFRNVYSLIK